jgi:hypothetical protein
MKKKSKWSIVEDVPKFPNGGATNPPIYVNDPNDPRLRMYNDSLIAYNRDIHFDKDFINLVKNAKSIDEIIKGKEGLDKKYPFNNIKPSWKSSDIKNAPILMDRPDLHYKARNQVDFKKPKQPYIFDKDLSATDKLASYFKLIPDKSKGFSGTMSLISKKDSSILNTDYINHKRQQEEIIPFNKMGLESLDPLQSMQRVPEPNPITSVPKDYVTIKTGSSYRNPETGAFEQKSFKIDKLTGKRILSNGGRTIPESIQPEYSKNYTGTFLPLNQNPDGSLRKKLYDNNNGDVSTESVIGIDDETGYYNIPTVINGVRFPNNNAIDEFYKNGYHTGYFTNQEDADKSADSRERANIGLASTGLYKNGGKISNWTIID